MSDIEIEIQVKIENSEVLLAFLEKNAEFQSEQHQIDEYFTPTHRDFLNKRPINEWLRLRSSNGKYSITYKDWHTDENGRGHHCDEYESEIESLNQLKKIFGVLNFKSMVTVDKRRKIWNYEEYEISIDTVKELGDFVEIEYKGKDEQVDPKTITQEMIKFLKDINCGKIERNYVGYPFQLLFPEEVKFDEE